MNFEWTSDDLEIRSWAKKFAHEVIAPVAVKHSKEKISKELLKRIADEGFSKLLIPEGLGGLGLSSTQFSLVIREISKICGSVGVTIAVTNMIAEILVREGNQEHHEKFLSQLVSGESLTASFCLTENGSGSDAAGLKTFAVKTGSGYLLTGEKIYVTNGAFSEFFLVMAKTSDVPGARGISAFLIPRSAKGVVLGKEEDKMGLTGSSTLRMTFDQVEVHESQRLGPEGEGFKIAMRALDGGRISVSSQALGIAEAALQAGVQYSKEREAFGKPIADFQAIQWKIADAATQLAASVGLIAKAAFLKDQKKPFGLDASRAKLFSTESAIQVCDSMIQVFGGYGYIKEYPVERYYRDVRVTSLYEGTSEIQRIVIARAVIGVQS